MKPVRNILSFHILQEYSARVVAFQRNARLYLFYVIIAGAALGIVRLLFNFYVLSLGYDQALLGQLVTANNMAALAAALPAGYLSDRVGRKAALLIAGLVTCLSMVVMVVWPQVTSLYLSNIVMGMAQSLAAVTMAPYLMESSSEGERTYLFSFSSGLQMAASSLGAWVGGYLPTWMGTWLGVLPTSSRAYGVSVLSMALLAGAGLLPLVFIRLQPVEQRNSQEVFAPLKYAASHPTLLAQLILPMLVTSIGAGLIMPFMNVFYREVYHQPDPVIGTLFAWGSLAMGVGLLAAPPLAERMGKIKLVVVTQALSIPFLVLTGFAPWFWLSAASYYIRMALMNMSGPIYQTFVMEHVDASARATVASLVSMAWNFGWAFSPVISGILQVRYGFAPAFIGTIVLYLIAIIMYWAFFWHRSQPAQLPSPVN